MKIEKFIAAGAVIAVIALTPTIANAQSNTGAQTGNGTAVKQDQHNLNQAEDKMAADKAQRDKDEKNGHPNQAVAAEKNVQKDNSDVKADKKDLSKDKAASQK